MRSEVINRQVEECNRHLAIDPEYFTPWEQSFLESLNEDFEAGELELTFKQKAALEKIYEKARKR